MKKIDKFMYKNRTAMIFWFSLVLTLGLGIFGSYGHENFTREMFGLWLVRIVFIVLIPYAIIYFLVDIRYSPYNDLSDSCSSAIMAPVVLLGLSIIVAFTISSFKFAFLGG